MADPVLFYEGRWYMFSNFSSFAISWKGWLWLTTEHAYQAAKFNDQAIATQIRNARSAHDAKAIARQHNADVRKDWDDIRVDVMREILRIKIEQHPYVKRKLLETEAREIIENSPHDAFWGRGVDWKGTNWLGKLWMELRAEISSKT